MFRGGGSVFNPAAPGAIGGTTPAAGAFTTLSSSGLYTPTGGIKGISTNTNAAAGNIGEYVTAALASGSATALSTGAGKTIISISLTVGDWDVSGIASFIPGATTNITVLNYGSSLVNNTQGAEDTYGSPIFPTAGTVNTGAVYKFPIPQVRVSVGSTTTVYLVAAAVFTLSTLTAYGTISARRVQPGA